MHYVQNLWTTLNRIFTSSKSSKSRKSRPVLFVTEIVETRQLLSAASAAIAPVATEPTTVIHEQPHVRFSANLGTFVAVQPVGDLTVSINWGDGKVTSGHLKPDGIVGVDQTRFEVIGSHRYAHPGTYDIEVTVSRPGVTSTNPTIIAQFHDQAIVAHRQRHH